MLLTHTSGVGYEFLDPSLLQWHQAVGRIVNTSDWTRESQITPCVFEPGHGWCYGIGLDWAGLVVEHITGLTLGGYMQQHIFGPLGMKDTGFMPGNLPETASRTAAWTYRPDAQSNLEQGRRLVPEEYEFESGGSGLHTTASDYIRFLQGLIRGQLLTVESLDQLLAPQLNETQSQMMVLSAEKHAMAPEFPQGIEMNHGLGGIMNLVDLPGKRRNGSMAWSGILNSRWVSIGPNTDCFLWGSCP